MHEMSLAMSIIELATSRAYEAGAHTINKIEVEVGDLSGVTAEALVFCFEAVSRNSLAETAELKLIKKAGKARCLGCGLKFAVESLAEPCPACGDYLHEVVEGREFRLLSLTVDE
jgi:hydrogenase nickel incorporation protein HypA/HybF